MFAKLLSCFIFYKNVATAECWSHWRLFCSASLEDAMHSVDQVPATIVPRGSDAPCHHILPSPCLAIQGSVEDCFLAIFLGILLFKKFWCRSIYQQFKLRNYWLIYWNYFFNPSPPAPQLEIRQDFWVCFVFSLPRTDANVLNPGFLPCAAKKKGHCKTLF